jgi:hypothetical protein
MEHFYAPGIGAGDTIFLPEHQSMIKSVTAGVCLLALTSSFALAQTSQGTTTRSPTAQSSHMNPMNANAKMKKKKMKHHSSMKSDSGMSGDMSKGDMSKGGTSGDSMKK